MKIAITGSRDVSVRSLRTMYSELKVWFGKCTMWYVGGAEGVDNYALIYLLENSQPVIAVVPFKRVSQPRACSKLLSRCNKVVELNGKRKSYSEMVESYYARNMYMVDNADVVLAFHNGNSCGTIQCIKYAKKKRKEVRVIRIKAKGAGNK